MPASEFRRLPSSPSSHHLSHLPGQLLHRLLAALTVLLLSAPVLVAMSGAAEAADGYRYWNYFHEKSGSWEFAQTAAAEHTPTDGAIEAYRYGTSTTAKGIEPRVNLDKVNFEALCAAEKPSADEKRVGILLDYGTEADADDEVPPTPRGECVVIAKDADGQQVLDAVAEVRVEKGLTCAIDGYPAQGCGDPVKDAEVATDEAPVAFDLPASDSTQADPTQADPTQADAAEADPTQAEPAQESSDGNGLLWPLVGVGAVVAAIAAGALVLNRRNRSA